MDLAPKPDSDPIPNSLTLFHPTASLLDLICASVETWSGSLTPPKHRKKSMPRRAARDKPSHEAPPGAHAAGRLKDWTSTKAWMLKPVGTEIIQLFYWKD